MLDRPKHLPFRTDQREHVQVGPGETPQLAYKSWLAKITTSARFCNRHVRTTLVWSRDQSDILPVYEESVSWRRELVEKAGELNFIAAFSCPACYVEYACCPPEFHETSFNEFDQSTPERAATLAKAREFAAQVNARGCGFAVFVGPSGAGKTRLACNVIRELEHRDALYVRQGELTSALRSTYGRKDVILHRSQSRYDDEAEEDDPPTPLEIVQKVRFLVLDEIGCTILANDERLLLDELIKHRYEHRKPTIFISNLPLTGPPAAPGLKDFLGDALADRIQEATGNGKFIVQFNGESYRRSSGGNYLAGIS